MNFRYSVPALVYLWILHFLSFLLSENMFPEHIQVSPFCAIVSYIADDNLSIVVIELCQGVRQHLKPNKFISINISNTRVHVQLITFQQIFWHWPIGFYLVE